MQSGHPGSERYSFSNHVCRDTTAYARALSAWECEVQQLDCTVFRGSVAELSLGAFLLIRERIEQPFAFRCTTKRRTLNLMCVGPSASALTYTGQKIGSDLLVAFPSHRSDPFYGSGPAESITLIIDESLVATELQRLFAYKVSEECLRCTTVITDAGKVARFRAGTLQMFEQVAARPSLLESEGGREALRERGLELIADALESEAFSAARLPPPSTRSYVVDKAIRFMDARLADPLATADICAALRVSPRTLRYSFEEVVGVSPARFLRARRLAQVRHDLLHGSTPSVYRIAQRYGFGHMSRFARLYQQAYGERPSDTVFAATQRRDRRAAARGAAPSGSSAEPAASRQ